MAAGIWAALVLAALALVFLTFRGGVDLYKKILGWLTLAGLVYFYQNELFAGYRMLSAGDYKTQFKELASVMQIAMPALVFALFWSAFIVSSAMDAGKILLFAFVIFLLSSGAKIALML